MIRIAENIGQSYRSMLDCYELCVLGNSGQKKNGSDEILDTLVNMHFYLIYTN